MAKTRRRFTTEEKAAILAEAAANGVSATAKQYKLARTVITRWQSFAGITKTKRSRRGKVSPEVRAELVAAVLGEQKTPVQAAKEAGVTASRVYAWLKEARAAGTLPRANGKSNGVHRSNGAHPSAGLGTLDPISALAETEALIEGVLAQIRSAQTALQSFRAVFGGVPVGSSPHAERRN